MVIEEDNVHRRIKIDADNYIRVDSTQARKVEIVIEDQDEENELNKDSAYQMLREEDHIEAAEPDNVMVNQSEMQGDILNAGKCVLEEPDNNASPKQIQEDHENIEEEQEHRIGNEQNQNTIQEEEEEENDEELKQNQSLKSPEWIESSEEDEEMDVETKPKGLHDWINRSLTGFNVFTNTIKYKHESQGEALPDDFVRERWNNLENNERKEYSNYASIEREKLKHECQDLEEESPEFKEVQKTVAKRIKMIIKE